METDEFSFVLKPGKYGIGVHAVVDITAGAKLNMFGKNEQAPRTIDKDQVPVELSGLCIDLGENKLLCPNDFTKIELGWFLNHSNDPNAEHKNLIWYAKRDISKGEEILIDYNSLDEPEDLKDDYYLHKKR